MWKTYPDRNQTFNIFEQFEIVGVFSGNICIQPKSNVFPQHPKEEKQNCNSQLMEWLLSIPKLKNWGTIVKVNLPL